MRFGPIQLLLFGFESNKNFKGDILRELNTVRGFGIIRIIDGLFILKDEAGNLVQIADSDLSVQEATELGGVVAKMMGMGDNPDRETMMAAVEAMEDSFGLGTDDIERIKDQLKPGTSALILMIEHVWAIRLREAMQAAGGHMIAQGMLTPDALLIIGKELDAMVQAEVAIELADAVKGAALLEALTAIADAEAVVDAAEQEAIEAVGTANAIKTAAAAEAVRALVIAGLIEEAAVEEAIDVLVEAELIEAAAVESAAKTVEARQTEVNAVKAEVDAAG